MYMKSSYKVFLYKLKLLFRSVCKFFMNILRYFVQIHGFPIEDMHNIGGGAALTAIGCVFGTDDNITKATVQPEVLNLVDAYTEAWPKPKEIGRDPFPVRNLANVKMRVAHNYITYMVIPLLCVDKIREAIQRVPQFKETCDVADLLMVFVTAIHLICMTTHESPSKYDITFAEECFNSYVRGMFLIFGFKFMTYKNHCLLHLAGEARALKSHMGGFNAYPFESFLGYLRRVYVRTGKNVLKQVYNKLVKKAYHGSLNEDSTNDGRHSKVEIDDEAWVKLAKEHGSLNFPQWTVFDSNVGKGRKYVTCRGFELTTK